MIYFILVLAAIALLSIVLEEVTHINKAKSVFLLGCISWIALFVQASQHQGSAEINLLFNENLLDIASLWLFLMATMTFVAYINGRGLIGSLVGKILPTAMGFRRLTLIVATFAVVLSMLCDNITATLVTLGVIKSFRLETSEQAKLGVLTVFGVNSGGTILITGDVTTLMIFNDGHVTISQLLTLIVPALVGVLTLAILVTLGGSRHITAEIAPGKIRKLDVVIGVLFFSTIVATMVFNISFGIPPILTFLTGLSMMFMLGGLINKYRHEIHLLEYVRQIQFDTLLFFLGILLIIGALKEVGVLVWITDFYFSVSPNISNFILGVLSALVDNVPLTAALLKAQPELNASQWLGLTYAVGVGGSMLVIGSAAGIIAMSRLPAMTFFQYARYIPHLLVAYTVGYVIAVKLVG